MAGWGMGGSTHGGPWKNKTKLELEYEVSQGLMLLQASPGHRASSCEAVSAEEQGETWGGNSHLPRGPSLSASVMEG